MSRTKEEIVAKPVRSDHVDTYGPWAWIAGFAFAVLITWMMFYICLLYTSPSPRDGLLSRMPSSA